MRRRLLLLLWAAAAIALAPGSARAQADRPAPPTRAADAAGSAARFAFFTLHGGAFPVFERHARELGVEVAYFTGKDLEAGPDLSGFDAVIIGEGVLPAEVEPYRRALLAARARRPGQRAALIADYGESLGRDEAGGPLCACDPELGKYYFSASRENFRRLLLYALHAYAGRDVEVPPPVPPLRIGMYHPEHEGAFADVAALRRWLEERGASSASTGTGATTTPTARPVAVVLAHALHLAIQQPRVVAALVAALERQGLAACVVVDIDDAPEGRGRFERLMLELRPAIVVHTCHSVDTVELREKLDCPHVHSIFFRRQSIDEWRASPTGISPNDAVFQVLTQEILGAIEPQVGAGPLVGGGSAEDFTPIDERVEHLARRAASLVRLRTTLAAEKRIALVYYDRSMGKSELMRGTPTGMYMNAPRSAVRLLARLAQEGYRVEDPLRDERDLVERMMSRGRQVGIWAPGELDRLVREGDPALVPEETYRAWYERRVPEAARAALEKQWGPPPGRFMVVAGADGRRSIVIPRIRMGNVTLLPQPLRGEAHDPRLTHDRKIPPPHNYLATYFWLEEELHAHAVIHFGTHGTEIALPGKGVGLGPDDWDDMIMGALPNVNPWIIDNLDESLAVRRRAYGIPVGHLVPPIVKTGLDEGLRRLHGDVEKWKSAQEGAVKARLRDAVTAAVKEQRLEKDIGVPDGRAGPLSDEEVLKLDEHLHTIAEGVTPLGLHVLGEPPSKELATPYIVTALRAGFARALAGCFPAGSTRTAGAGAGTGTGTTASAETATARGDAGELREAMHAKVLEVVDLHLRAGLAPAEAIRAAGGRPPEGPLPEALEKGFAVARHLADGFAKTPRELDGIVAALAGRFVTPGPGAEPTRNPGSVPTGRDVYVLNPEEVPSRASWEVGKALADRMLEDRRGPDGRLPSKIGFDLNSFATFQDYGVMESEILRLVGTEPVWDEKNLVHSVTLTPRAALGRPRVDVFIATLSYYRDHLPSRMALIDRAIRLAASADEPDNGVRRDTLAVRASLVQKGVPEARAGVLAGGRIYGYAPGEYGDMNHYYMVERSGEWDTREEIADLYLAQVKHLYTEGAWGESADAAYDASIQGTSVVVRSWSDTLVGPLSNKYAWLHGGSLALAVQRLTGKQPEMLLSDVRDPDASRLVSAEDAVHEELRVRLFNRAWIEALMREGYAGADQVAVHASNLMGWEIMREGIGGDAAWMRVKEVYLDDAYGIGARAWLERDNPFALQDLATVMLESARKGYWKPDAETRAQIAEAYVRSVAAHGPGGGLRGGGNARLTAYVERALEARTESRLDPAIVAQWREKARAAREAAGGTARAPGEAPGAVAAGASASAGGRAAEAALVTGRKLEAAPRPATTTAAAPRSGALPAQAWVALAALLGALVVAGYLRGGGAP